jgi:hypothetical protein
MSGRDVNGTDRHGNGTESEANSRPLAITTS